MSLDAIPDELKARPQWVVWRQERRGDAKPTKVPYRADRPATHASVSDPSTWATYDAALAAVAADPGLAGIGYVFSPLDPYVGIDFDAAINGGEVADWAVPYLDALTPTYAEVSPSGNGVKAIVRADYPGPADAETGKARNGLGPDGRGRLEMYHRNRFFTITGDLWADADRAIHERPDAVRAIYDLIRAAKVRAKEPPPRDPTPIDVRIRAYVSKFPPAISGSGGHDATFDLACQLVRKFGLSEREVLAWLEDWNRTHCDPPWSDHELAHKAADAVKAVPPSERGQFLRNEVLSFASVSVHGTANGSKPLPDQDKGSSVLSGLSVPDQEEEWEHPVEVASAPVDAKAFPLDVFPPSLRALCEQGAAAIHAPVDYFAALALGVAGIALGQSTTLCLKQSWEEAGNLYLAVVGGPGSKKSPVLKLMCGVLWEIDRDLREQYKAAKREYDRIRATEEGRNNPNPPPERRRAVTDDATKEGFSKILAANWRGVAVVKDELTAWVASLNSYRQGKGDDRQFWMKLNTRSAVAVDRAKDEDDPLLIPSPCVSVLGCMTPATMAALKGGGDDDGWFDRIVFSFPDPVEPPADWEEDRRIDGQILEAYRAAIKHLYHRYRPGMDDRGRLEPVRVLFTAEGKAVWRSFYRSHHAEQRAVTFPRGLVGPWSKLEGFAARFALILAQLRRAYEGEDRGPVDACDMAGAWALCDYFKAHFRRARNELFARHDEPDETHDEILKWIDDKALTEFSGRDVLRKFRWMTEADRDRAMAWLERHRYVRVVAEHQPGKIGRPSKRYEVNPKHRDGKDGKARTWLARYLSRDAMKVRHCLEDGKEKGHDEDAIARAARSLGVIEIEIDGEPGWQYRGENTQEQAS